jgi:hypothetical protein
MLRYGSPMVKRKTQASRARSAQNGAELAGVADVFARAAQLYPKLLASRDHHARELAKLEHALAVLEPIVERRAERRAPEGNGEAPSIARTRAHRAARDGKRSAREIALATLSEGKQLVRADIVDAILSERPDIKRKSAWIVIDRLKREGVLSASGGRKHYKYAIALG